MKKLHIISIQKEYLTIVAYQLFDIFGDQVELYPITLQQLTMETVAEGDLVLLSKEVLRGITASFIPASCPVIVANREVNIAATEKLSGLPFGQRILIINDTVEHAVETATSLKKIYYEHHYKTYDPMNAVPSDIDWIVTPGEMELVPAAFKNVIDIGPRTLDFLTIEQVESELKTTISEIVLMNRFFKSQVTVELKRKSTTKKNETGTKQVDIVTVENRKETHFTLSLSEIDPIKNKIETHGFLDESLVILSIYKEGKESYELLGRAKVKERLVLRGIKLSDQQLRLRLEIMQDEQLIHARIGRGGTRISEKGEAFLEYFMGIKE
ncbi:winged-helix domain-containing protein [Sporosarcina sp. ZBG7A]|uniref:winged-helix domain-containing protein n=1 Tax=Sporosarcina sp. ZBG7A TaxID=1582223 RepID=UPI00057A644E|nr:winged-helix domain-containing protein [Sporosarcina sp. ZBG7A]